MIKIQKNSSKGFCSTLIFRDEDYVIMKYFNIIHDFLGEGGPLCKKIIEWK